MSFKSGVEGRGSDRWWEQRWWLWWGDMRRMRWRQTQLSDDDVVCRLTFSKLRIDNRCKCSQWDDIIGYVKSVITVEELLESYDDQLFHKASYSNHCLHRLLPVANSVNYALRDVGHGLLIDHVTSELHKRTFINRMLFSNCYWVSAY